MPHPSRFAYDGAFWRKVAATGARRLPRWWLRYSPPFFGVAAAVALPEARRAVQCNLERIRGPAPAWRDALDTARTFATYASCLAEALAQGSRNGARLHATYAGAEHVTEALSLGRGGLLLTMHTAGWELATPLFTHETKLDVMVVMEAERSAGAQAIQDGARASSGARFLHVGEDPLSALPILHHLQKKGVVALQIDRAPPNGRVVEVELMGKPYAIPEGPLRIAQLSGAPMLPVFAARRGFHEYHLRAHAPIMLPRRATAAEVRRAAQTIADAMGSFLRDHPTQWFEFGRPPHPAAPHPPAPSPRGGAGEKKKP